MLREYFRDFSGDVFDPEDERDANRTSQIAIAAFAAVYVGIFAVVLMDRTQYTIGEFMLLFGEFALAILVNIIMHSTLSEKAPQLKKYFLMGVLFVACISLEAATQMMTALFLSLPILIACRYRDRRFIVRVIVLSFVAVIMKEWLSWAIGMYDLNVVSIHDNTLIENGRLFQLSVMDCVDMTYYLEDIVLFSIIPQWVQLAVISVVALILENNGRKLRNHQREAIRREAASDAELKTAREIQMGLLPDKFDLTDRVELYASSIPAKNVGGDFYDCFMVDGTHLAVVIADVSGKGTPAALFMATTMTSIRDRVKLGLSPAEVFTGVNNAANENNSGNLFVTAWLGILDTETGMLTFVNAGHNPPLICYKDRDWAYIKMKTNIVLGFFEGINYKEEQLQLKPGDAMFLYTDGVTESQTAEGELYGESRLRALLSGHRDSGSAELVSLVNEDTRAFAGPADQFDDITVLAFKYKG